MTKLLCLLPLGAAAALALPTPAVAGNRDCALIRSDEYRLSAVKTRNASCPAAHRLIRQVVKRSEDGGCILSSLDDYVRITQPCVRKGYACYLKNRQGDNTFNVRCLKGNTQVIRWRLDHRKHFGNS